MLHHIQKNEVVRIARHENSDDRRMPPKSYDAHFKNFAKTLELGCDRDAVRRRSKDFATALRQGVYDIYARKYHAFLFTHWCEVHGVEMPSDWDAEGYWSLTFH
jgi:hypothetical protein